MKFVLALVCVLVVAVAAQHSIDEHLFDGLVQELGKVLRGLYQHDKTITQVECVNDCDTNMGLRDNLCKDICKLAAQKYHFILST